MKHLRRVTTLAAAVAATSLVLAACGSGDGGDGGDGAADGRVTITVSGLPDNSKPEERAAFEADLDAFRAANPDIDITAVETLWDPQTFSAQLAGGTLPTVIDLPPSEMNSLIANGQVKDLTDVVQASATLRDVPDAMMEFGLGPDGRYYGVPTYAYSMGLMINRDLFERAGLDPDEPLATWDDVRAAAKAITEATGEVGYATPATEGYAGWILDSALPAFGGEMMTQVDGEWVLDLTAQPIQDLLQLLHDMRWEDGSMGVNSLITDGDINNMLAAGQLGMAVRGGDAYQNMTLVSGMPKEDYGMFPMPQTADGLGTGGGGRVAIVRPDATDAQAEAVVRWLEFHNFAPYMSEENAVAWATARDAEGLPVPEVGLPRVTGEVMASFMGWIDPYVNVPMPQIQTYLDSADTLTIHGGPPYAAGEIYESFAPVIQAVLGREDADIPALLQTAQDTSMPAVEAALPD
ncbi:ABC-type glycerol-3-phosphate transport system substrate-binding protein [Salana multivorans]|uniref:ABC-type glycerol-3-phosphate transport system substrate-binding protein n=1 Tax=Salana multivorans TaxID=120377 RepID=A0A3N2DAQ8_9MICO|nr:extracellular solute-binding protein [Salana multivorans]ROR96890.1 ABC-type glycerol-3-phosphate transport system substrate-binding protein [Salana multivorans]